MQNQKIKGLRFVGKMTLFVFLLAMIYQHVSYEGIRALVLSAGAAAAVVLKSHDFVLDFMFVYLVLTLLSYITYREDNPKMARAGIVTEYLQLFVVWVGPVIIFLDFSAISHTLGTAHMGSLFIWTGASLVVSIIATIGFALLCGRVPSQEGLPWWKGLILSWKEGVPRTEGGIQMGFDIQSVGLMLFTMFAQLSLDAFTLSVSHVLLASCSLFLMFVFNKEKNRQEDPPETCAKPGAEVPLDSMRPAVAPLFNIYRWIAREDTLASAQYRLQYLGIPSAWMEAVGPELFNIVKQPDNFSEWAAFWAERGVPREDACSAYFRAKETPVRF